MDEHIIAAFEDELEKLSFVGALGGAARGGLHAARELAGKALLGQRVGGLRGAAAAIGEAGKSQAALHNMAAKGQTVAKNMSQHIKPDFVTKGLRRGSVSAADDTASVLRKNRLVGGALTGVAGLGAAGLGSRVGRWASEGEQV